MSTELIINASLPETRIALMEGGEIQDLLIERATGKGIVGNIYKGRVTRVLPGMQAAFVDIGLEKAAFLYVDDVFVHSEIWEQEEGQQDGPQESPSGGQSAVVTPLVSAGQDAAAVDNLVNTPPQEANAAPHVAPKVEESEAAEWAEELRGNEEDDEEEGDGTASSDPDDEGPAEMGLPPGEGEGGNNDGGEGSSGGSNDPQGTVRAEPGSSEGNAGGEGSAEGKDGEKSPRHRRGRRGGRFRRRDREGADGVKVEGSAPEGRVEGDAEIPAPRVPRVSVTPVKVGGGDNPFASFDDGSRGNMPSGVEDHFNNEPTDGPSDRSAMGEHSEASAHPGSDGTGADGRPEPQASGRRVVTVQSGGASSKQRPEFKEPRSRDRKIKAKSAPKAPRAQANIQDILKEGQEVLVQVAKDPISTKGARLTCHISLPGRHLVCMPTIDHVGVSRRIERDDERRKLREYVEKYRPKGLGFIVRTASGRQQSEQRIEQDINYLSRLWNEIREKSAQVQAPALVYEDLNSVLRAIRDWVTEDIDKIVVDSKYHFNDIHRFASHFMPSLKQKVEFYQGTSPIFDSYGISTELARGLERKVWLKSGGYLVIDQAEALVAIDVNTGRFVGKKNLEDTILKTNLEAVQEIAYQLRLRNCGGIIILDLIDMDREENKQRVYRALEEALKKDRARPSILKISELGLVEMTRKRTRDTMVRALCESCSHCEGKGFVKSKQTVAYEILRELERDGSERGVEKILVQAHSDVIDVLAIEERDSLEQLERRYRKQIYLQAVSDYHPEKFEVTGDRHGGTGVQPVRGRDSERTDRNERGGERSGRGGRDRGRGRDRERGGRDRNDRDRNKSVSVKPVDAAVSFNQSAQGERGLSPQAQDTSATYGASAARETMPDNLQNPRTPQDEEDRLAFLRAQATQDAALARLNGGGSPGAGGATGQPRGPRDPNREERGGRGGRSRRGRRGGRGRDAEGRGPRDGATAGPPTGTSVLPVPVNRSESSGDSGGSGGGDNSGPPPQTT